MERRNIVENHRTSAETVPFHKMSTVKLRYSTEASNWEIVHDSCLTETVNQEINHETDGNVKLYSSF